MKKLLVLSLTCLLLAACGDKDDDNTFEKKGYLTSLEQVKKGILGVWKSPDAVRNYYYNYRDDGITCDGYSIDILNVDCVKYEIYKKEDRYILRVNQSNNSTKYNEVTITELNNERLVYVGTRENVFVRVK